jgi:hypothetical protein
MTTRGNVTTHTSLMDQVADEAARISHPAWMGGHEIRIYSRHRPCGAGAGPALVSCASSRPVLRGMRMRATGDVCCFFPMQCYCCREIDIFGWPLLARMDIVVVLLPSYPSHYLQNLLFLHDLLQRMAPISQLRVRRGIDCSFASSLYYVTSKKCPPCIDMLPIVIGEERAHRHPQSKHSRRSHHFHFRLIAKHVYAAPPNYSPSQGQGVRVFRVVRDPESKVHNVVEYNIMSPCWSRA